MYVDMYDLIYAFGYVNMYVWYVWYVCVYDYVYVNMYVWVHVLDGFESVVAEAHVVLEEKVVVRHIQVHANHLHTHTHIHTYIHT